MDMYEFTKVKHYSEVRDGSMKSGESAQAYVAAWHK